MFTAGARLHFALLIMAIRVALALYLRRLAYHYTRSQHSVRSRRHGISHGYHARPTRVLERYGIRPTATVRQIKSSPIVTPSVDAQLLVA